MKTAKSRVPHTPKKSIPGVKTVPAGMWAFFNLFAYNGEWFAFRAQFSIERQPGALPPATVSQALQAVTPLPPAFLESALRSSSLFDIRRSLGVVPSRPHFRPLPAPSPSRAQRTRQSDERFGIVFHHRLDGGPTVSP